MTSRTAKRIVAATVLLLVAIAQRESELRRADAAIAQRESEVRRANAAIVQRESELQSLMMATDALAG